MRLNALVLCRHQVSLRSLAAAFEEAGMEQQVCKDATQAVELLVGNRYSALIIDFDLPESTQVVKMARMTAADRRPVIFAMIGPNTPVGGALQTGVNFVLYKPLEHEQLASSLRSGRHLMKGDRRKASRQKLEALVYLQFGAMALPALILDVSEQGLALQAPDPLPPVQKIPVRFLLPGTSHLIEAVGEVIWTDDTGRAGMFFANIKPAARKHLKQWLGRRGLKRSDAVSALLQPRSRRSKPLSH